MIHRYWRGDPPDEWTGRVLRRLHPGIPVTDWTPDTAPAAALDLAAGTAHLVVPARHVQHEANIVRLVLLWEHGGWWADHDLVPLDPFPTLPSPATAGHRYGRRCNCWLAFPAQHPALADALDAIAATAPGPPRQAADVSGEGLLTRLWGDDIGRLPLPVDASGHPNPDAPRWAVHLHHTSRHS